MPRTAKIFATLILAAALGACAQSKPVDPMGTFYVPTTLILQSPDYHPSPLAYQVLPGADYEDFFVPRAEKFAYGPTTLESLSAYSVLEYDAQRISSPRGSGYRYTWSVREGVAFP